MLMKEKKEQKKKKKAIQTSVTSGDVLGQPAGTSDSGESRPVSERIRDTVSRTTQFLCSPTAFVTTEPA